MLLLLLACLGLLLVIGQRRRAGIACLSVALGAYAAIAFLPLGAWLLAPIENRFPQPQALPPSVTGIIVLGGAVETALSAAHGMPALNAAAERMTSFVTLARRYPQAKLVFTGGNGELVHADLTEADVAKQLFDGLGLADRNVIYEHRSRTTYENVRDLKALLKPQPSETWLLITSAWHMPRAMGLFQQADWPVLAYPVGYKTGPGLVLAFRGSFPDRLELVDLAAHEWLGLTAYWLLGRTSALFPAPQG
ncbi:YdcF family protein [Acidisoma cellulosilytica]|uniref:YdcF family protein n=2 Tax=Acidisoma cellulosilyticum TaxID=2802395 RepID=A0A963Z287_9PROT|nr:YdcF family protein [Acidisoma cellulosilyticum]